MTIGFKTLNVLNVCLYYEISFTNDRFILVKSLLPSTTYSLVGNTMFTVAYLTFFKCRKFFNSYNRIIHTNIVYKIADDLTIVI